MTLLHTYNEIAEIAVGERLRDREGVIWTRIVGDRWQHPSGATVAGWTFDTYGPFELVEADAVCGASNPDYPGQYTCSLPAGHPPVPEVGTDTPTYEHANPTAGAWWNIPRSPASTTAAFAPVQVTNEATLQSLVKSVGYALVMLDGDPALIWQDEEGDWRGTRPVTEDDGPWEEIPAGSRETLAVQVHVDLSDPEECLPLSVLWADGPFEVFPDECESCTGIESVMAIPADGDCDRCPDCHGTGYAPAATAPTEELTSTHTEWGCIDLEHPDGGVIVTGDEFTARRLQYPDATQPMRRAVVRREVTDWLEVTE